MKKNETEIMNPPIEIPVPTDTEATIKVYTIEEVKEADKHAKKVTFELGKAEKAFTQIACELMWLYEDNRYKALETASTFEHFAFNRFGFKKTQAYGLRAMVSRFGVKNEDGTYSIDEKYKKYSHTKLILMCNARLSDEEILSHTSPNMTVNELKKAIKELTALEGCNEDSTASVIDDTPSEVIATPVDNNSNEIESNVIDVTSTVHNSQSLVTYSTFEEFEAV